MQPPPPGYGPPRPGMMPMMQQPMGFPNAAFMGSMGPPQLAPPGMMLRPPPPMMRPLPQMPRPMAPTLPKPTGAGTALSRPPASRSTTLYVGKIAPSLEDSVVRALLEACGPVASWKRMQDSDGRPKGFGFCEFEEADGVVRALRHLSALAIDGQELLVKCSAATQQYVDEHVARKAVEAAARKAAAEEAASGGDTDMPDAAGAEGGLPPPPAGGDPEVARDNEVLEKIMTIVSDRAAISAAPASTEAAGFLSRLGGGAAALTPPRQETRSEAHHGGAYASRAEERARTRERQPDVDRDFERSRGADRKEAEARAAEVERLYRDRLAKLEKRERERLREAERQAAKEAAAERERARLVKADIVALDEPDDGLPPWQRRPYSITRKAEERRRRRAREQEEDAVDRAAEAEEKRQRRLENAASPSDSEEARQNGHALPQLNAAPDANVDPADPIYRAMIAAARAPAVKAELEGAGLTGSPSGGQSAGSGISAGLFGKPPAKRNKSALMAAFGGEDDEEEKPRALKKLNYSAEELAAAQAQPAASVAATPAQNVADSKELMKRIVERMPSDRAGVFAYPIDWAAYDSLPAPLQGKISTWVGKTIKEMLGEEEQTLVEHVMEKLREHCTPAAMLEEMKEILDTDAEKFVLKMYRFVIYESEKQKITALE